MVSSLSGQVKKRGCQPRWCRTEAEESGFAWDMLVLGQLTFQGLGDCLVGSWLVYQSVAQTRVWAGERDVKTQGNIEAEATDPLSGQETPS